MERAVFLLEADGTRIPCLLNPENLVVRRTAGVRARGLTDGQMGAGASAYDPLLYTGGGRTEITMYLLFDVSLLTPAAPAVAGRESAPARRPVQPLEDVRELTRPLMALAEPQTQQGSVMAPVARFFWGKAWNIAGVVTAAAERLEYFTSAGIPRRSWLSMRFVQVEEEQTPEADAAPANLLGTPATLDAETPVDAGDVGTHDVLSDGVPTEDAGSAQRPDQIAAAKYGDPTWWRLITEYNGIDDPLQSLAGRSLMIPPKFAGGTQA